MSLITLVENAVLDLNLTSPGTVVGNSADEIKQILAIANREGNELASRYRWSALLKENTFTFNTAKDQGALNGTVVSAGDCDHIINDTIWDRTQGIPVCGPMSPVLRQANEAFAVAGPYARYFLRGKNLYFDVIPAANTGAFEYKSTHWCESEAGAGQSEWKADTDVSLLDEEIHTLGIIWRWLRRKGLDYQEEFRAYESRIADAMARDGTKGVVSLDGAVRNRGPGVIVPEGNWLQ